MKEIILVEDKRFEDGRGWFCESYNRDRFEELGIDNDWMQDNLSFSRAGTIRGIHYQLDGLAKLVRCVSGEIMDVVVDLRKSSDTFGQFHGYSIVPGGGSLYVPPGFGHSFIAIQNSYVIYKVDKPWNPDMERGVAYDDEQLQIPWHRMYGGEFILSDKDKALPDLRDADLFD